MSETQVHKLLTGLKVAARVAEARRKQANEKLRYFASSCPQVIIYTRSSDGDFSHTFVSDNVTSQLGYAPFEFTADGSFWRERVHPDDSDKAACEFSALLANGHHALEYRLQHKDGSYRWIRDEMNMVWDDRGNPTEILGSWTDITERKKSEEALQQSEARYRSLVENSPVGMVCFDRQGEITEFNPAVLRILGASSSEVRDAMDLFSLLPLFEAGISEALAHCLESGESTVGEFQYKSKLDREVYTRLHLVPIRGSGGRIEGAHVFVQDISDQKRAEDLIVSSERLKVLGQISSGVGVTFSNLLQIVSGNANMALTNLDLDQYEAIRLNLEEILKGAQEATEAVRWLQQFGRERLPDDAVRKEVFDLTDAVEEALEVSKLWSKVELERTKVRITQQLNLTSGCYVEGVRDQMVWAVLNLLKNAYEALRHGGRVKVSTSVKDDRVVLVVQDSGTGITDRDIKNITLAFWTTKQGHAGMGLSVNCGIIRQHKGSMGVKRMKPRGTAFTVRLPYVKDPSQRRQDLAKEAAKPGLRILLVDDEEAVVRIFSKGLKVLGQQPVPAYSGQQALTIFQESQVDAVVCDLVMPDMDGWEVAARIDEICSSKGASKPPFIMLTGWAAQLDEREVLSHAQVVRIVQKPISPESLLEIVSEEVKRSSANGAFSGTVDSIDLIDYMQLVMLTGKSGVVEVVLRSGDRGFVFVDKGKIVHARCGNLEGEEAVYHCLNFSGGSFSNLPWREPNRITIDRPGEFILLEAMRRRDEIRGNDKSDAP